MFITFEGVEGAGKSTQIRLLAECLRATGREVVVTREPGDGPLGPDLRRLVLQPPADTSINDRTELLIMLADRAQHVAHVIEPALARGAFVLCDRYIDSSAAYQGYGRGIDLVTIHTLNAFATNDLTPSRTILLDLDVEAGLARQADRNRMEMQSVAFHRKVRAGFLDLARQYPERFLVIDADGDVETVHARIRSALGPLVTP